MSKDYWISPSSFAWAWKDCQRCWWLQLKQQMCQPRSGLPPIVERVDRLSLDCLKGADLTLLGVPGTVRQVDMRVKCPTRELHGVLLTLGGRYDLLVELHDGSGWVVLDVKFTMPKPETAAQYRLQNSAYAWALREPAEGKPVKVVATGLLCARPLTILRPTTAVQIADQHTGEALYSTYSATQLDPTEDPESAMVISWLHVPQAANVEELEADIQQLRETMNQMGAMLAAERPPASAPGCQYCTYVRKQVHLANQLRAAGAPQEEPKP